MRVSKGILLTAVVGCLAAAGTSRGAMIINDNFDSYADQTAFQTAWPAIGSTAPTSALLSSTVSQSAPNSIQVPGTATNSQYRNRKSFSETGSVDTSHEIIWSFDFYDVDGTNTPQRNYSNLQDTTGPTGTNQLISMGLNNNHTNADSGGAYYMARILGYSPPTTDPDGGPNEGGTLGSGAYFKLNDYGVGQRSTGWHNLKVEITTNDAASTDYSFFVDGSLAETVNNVGTSASIRSYDNIAIGSGLSNGSIEADFDNMHLEYTTVPEPASLAVLGLAGLVVMRRRRR